MAQLERPQLERPQRPVNTSQTSPHTIHTMEQLLRAGEGYKMSPTYSHSSSISSSGSSPQSSPNGTRLKHHDMEEGQNQKKSVLAKVKEKARKLRYSLSKKKHEDGNVTSPSWLGLEDDGAEENAEYFGAPMYESEKAHEGYTENARQHRSPLSPEGYNENARQQYPRGGPVITEKHILSNNGKAEMEQDRENLIGRHMSKKTTKPTTTTTKTLAPAAAAATAASITRPGANKTVAEKLQPSNAEGSSETAHSITSKIQGLSVSTPAENHASSSSSSSTLKNANPSLFISGPKPLVKMHSTVSSNTPRTPTAHSTPAAGPLSAPAGSKNSSPTSQLWDKGVSVKEYLMNKFEPGEDEKALSQVISEAMSPRRTPGDAGVMEKVREAVTSLLRTDEPKKYADTTATTRASFQNPVSTNSNTAHVSYQTPLSTNHTARASSEAPVTTNINTARASSQGTVSTSNSTRAPSPSRYPISTYLHATSSQNPASTRNTSRASSQKPASNRNTSRASSQLPVSTNIEEVAQEENHGRILQTN